MKISILFIITSLLSNLLFGLETKEIKLKFGDEIKLKRELVQEYKPAYAKIKFQGKNYILTFDNDKINKKLIKEKFTKFIKQKEKSKGKIIATIIAIFAVFISVLFIFTSPLVTILTSILLLIFSIYLYPASFFPYLITNQMKIIKYNNATPALIRETVYLKNNIINIDALCYDKECNSIEDKETLITLCNIRDIIKPFQGLKVVFETDKPIKKIFLGKCCMALLENKNNEIEEINLDIIRTSNCNKLTLYQKIYPLSPEEDKKYILKIYKYKKNKNEKEQE